MRRLTPLFATLCLLGACRTATDPTPPADATPAETVASVSQPVEPAAPEPPADTTAADLARLLAGEDTPAQIREAYQRTANKPVFVSAGALTPAGSAALSLLDAAPREAITPETIGLDQLQPGRDAPDAAFELRLANSLRLWIAEQWPGNVNRLPLEQRTDGAAAVIDPQVTAALATVLELGPTDGAKTEQALKAMRPPLVQYERLIPVLARYEKIAAEGGWETKFAHIPRPRAKKYVRYAPKRRVPGKLIPAVKRRLRGEGYYAPVEEDDSWNDEFEAALLAYRERNQLWPRVWIDWELIESMQLPVEFRVIQTRLALERMRRSRVGDDKYYVHVVLPEFHAEVWENGNRLMRFRLVVGGRQRYREAKTGEWRFPNATPLFSDKIETVVLNPYWTVPPRLRKDLFKKQEKDPTYFEKEGYEQIGGSLRQKPGPKNALGEVKFLFPNDHAVYMHDTPRKDLFRSPMRAFSHGCMRVEEPLEFAWFLLSREGRDDLTRIRVRRNAYGGGQFRYKLEAGPKIHIEYWTVHVDDEGKVHFLEDIYLHDSREARDRFGLDLGNLK